MPQNAKKKISGLFSIAILRKSSLCVTSYQDVLVSFALLLRFNKKCFTRLCLKNLFLRLSLCLCVFARSVVNIQHSTGCVWLCFPGMTSSLAKGKQIIGAQFPTLFSTIFLLFDVLQYSNRFDYTKDIQPATYFNNQKIITYHL